MRTHLGRLLAGALLLSVGLLGQPLTAAPAEAAPSAEDLARLRAPAVQLAHPTHGRRAVELLGDRFDDAARANGLTAPELRALLLEDRTAWVGETGRVYFKDPAPELADHAPAEAAAAAAAAAAPYPVASTFLLHSKPGSQRVIFLDFDGADVSGTRWNQEYGVRAGFHPAWSLDADTSTFNLTERTAIQSVWQRVAEDYAPFDVDVTTQFPGEAAITRSGSGDASYGTRALISPSADALAKICDGGCGGVAYFDVFDEPAVHASLQPAWILPQGLGDDTKSIAEAVSHEVGHNLGLDHDGRGTLPYYEGHAAWAPIMGIGYDRPITQWSRGGYTGANNQEDDLAIIAGNGAPRRGDEAGATIGTAGPALPAGSAYITSRADVDVYELGQCSGPITVAARPAPTSPNLDIELNLLDASGSTLSTDNPLSTPVDWDVADGMSATLTRSVPAATYFVAVDGVGHGTPTTGYDDYGSLGAYTVELSSGSCNAATASPSVPQGLSVAPAPDGRSVAVSWTPPASDGGSPVTGYTVTRTGAAAVEVPAATNAWQWTGLEPGTPYTFTVAAINANGAGPQASTVAATPDVPSEPTAVTASLSPGTGTATMRWAPPGSNGGSPLTGYEVALDSGPWLPVGPGLLAHTFTGLVGTAHELSVRAVNAVGPGASVLRSVSTVTATVPSAPTNLGTRLDGTSLAVTWSPPQDDGGAAVTSYDVFLDGDSLDSVPADSGGLEISGLLRGQSYTVGLRAVNEVGAGPLARATVAVPAVVPSAARIGRATSGARGGRVTATATWTPPVSDGGAAVLGYQVRGYRLSSTGRVLSTYQSSLFGPSTRTASLRLPAKGRWRFAVRAQNAVGYGPLSAGSNIVRAR